MTVPRTVDRPTNKTHNFKELDRELLAIDWTEDIGTGTFGRCFTTIYWNNYQVVVKEIKVKDSSKGEIEQAKQEVLNEASVIADLGDHPGIPHPPLRMLLSVLNSLDKFVRCCSYIRKDIFTT